MENSDETTSRSATLERHVQTVVVSLLTAAVVYAGTRLVDDGAAQAAQAAKLETLIAAVTQLRADIKALEISYVRKDELSAIDLRLRHSEASIAVLKNRAGLRTD